MKYTYSKNNISEILKVYIINSITKSYILNTKIRPLVTEYALTIKLLFPATNCMEMCMFALRVSTLELFRQCGICFDIWYFILNLLLLVLENRYFCLVFQKRQIAMIFVYYKLLYIGFNVHPLDIKYNFDIKYLRIIKYIYLYKLYFSWYN